MIGKSKIEIVLLGMSAFLGVEGWRSGQSFDRPPEYFTYKIIFDKPDQKDQEIHVEDTITDPTIYPEILYRFGDATLSLNFFGNDYDLLRSKVESGKKFLEESSLWEENNLADQEYTNIQDRSQFLETEWESRFGFDIKIQYLNSELRETPSIDIEATLPTIQGTAQ